MALKFGLYFQQFLKNLKDRFLPIDVDEVGFP